MIDEPNGRVDPLYEYIDAKVAELKQDLQKEILLTQKQLASFIVVSTFTASSMQLPEKYHNQLISLTSAARAKIDTDDTPLSIAGKYYNDCYNILAEAGIETIEFG